MTSIESRVAGANGCFLIADTTARTGLNYYALVVREDTVISVLSGVDGIGATVNFLTTLGLSGKTLKASDLIIVPNNNKITTITFTSGSAIAY